MENSYCNNKLILQLQIHSVMANSYSNDKLSYCNNKPSYFYVKLLTYMIYSTAMIYNLTSITDSFNILIYFAYKPLFCIWLYGLSFGYIYAIMVQLNG